MPNFQEKILASPFDEGTAFPQYRAIWEGMNPFEKSLFFWAEVNALGLKLEETCGAPRMRMRFEALFNGGALRELMEFIGLARQESVANELENTKDEFRYLCDSWWHPQDIQNYPEIVETAVRLGYDPLDFDEGKLRERYLPAY